MAIYNRFVQNENSMRGLTPNSHDIRTGRVNSYSKALGSALNEYTRVSWVLDLREMRHIIDEDGMQDLIYYTFTTIRPNTRDVWLTELVKRWLNSEHTTEACEFKFLRLVCGIMLDRYRVRAVRAMHSAISKWLTHLDAHRTSLRNSEE